MRTRLSCCSLMFRKARACILLTGDAELDQEREFVQEVGDIDVPSWGITAQKFLSIQTCWKR